MAAGAGKVALVNNQTLIAAGTVCPTGATIVDFVGYGTGTNCFGRHRTDADHQHDELGDSGVGRPQATRTATTPTLPRCQ
jgi:hypothetical protein